MSSKLVVNTLGASNHSEEDREDLDFYQTPSYATKTLLTEYLSKFPYRNIWEPTAGNKAISKVIEQNGGYKVFSSDLVQRKAELDITGSYFDMTAETPGFEGQYAVVMNPPYKLATEFILHTLEKIKPQLFCIFLPIRYLEGKDRYEKIYSKYRPDTILTYSSRLGCYKDSDEVAGKVTSRGIASAVAYVWICFNKDNWSDPDKYPVLKWA